jgi:hypothetical protein
LIEREKKEKKKKRGFLVFGGFLRFKMGWHMLAFVSNNASYTRESETAGESFTPKSLFPGENEAL